MLYHMKCLSVCIGSCGRLDKKHSMVVCYVNHLVSHIDVQIDRNTFIRHGIANDNLWRTPVC